jgi:uncharacterized membrane protein
MKTKVLVGILILLIIVNLTTLGTYLYLRFVAPGEPAPGFPGGGPPPAIMELDPAARSQLRDLMMDFRREARPLQEQILRAEDSIAVLLEQEPVPADAVDRLFERTADLRVSINKMALRRLVQTKSFLPPEQQRLFFRAIMEARPQMGPRGGFGRGPFMGPDSDRGRPFGPEGRPHRDQPPLE